REPRLAQRPRRWAPRAAPFDLALADQRQRHLRELDEIAAGAYAADLAHEGMQACIEHSGEEVEQGGSDTRDAPREHLRAHEHGGAYELGWVRSAEGAGVAANQIALELLPHLGCYGVGRERPAAGRQPIDRRALANEIADESERALDALPGFGAD